MRVLPRQPPPDNRELWQRRLSRTANCLPDALEREFERNNFERLQIEMNDAIADGERFLVGFEQIREPSFPDRQSGGNLQPASAALGFV